MVRPQLRRVPRLGTAPRALSVPVDAVAIIRELQVRLDTLHRIEVEPDHAPTMLAFLAGKIEA